MILDATCWIENINNSGAFSCPLDRKSGPTDSSLDVKLACEDGRELTAPVARQTMQFLLCFRREQPAQRGKEQADSLLATHPAPQAKHTMQAEAEQRGDQVRDSSGPRKFRSSVVCNGHLCPTLTALFLLQNRPKPPTDDTPSLLFGGPRLNSGLSLCSHFAHPATLSCQRWPSLCLLACSPSS